MTVPTVYRWDDANAPVLSGTVGSMVNLLTNCLVTGYGSKEAAGWAREYANTELTKAAFRNDSETGNGFFLRVDETTPGATAARLQGYETMTDIDTGLGPFFSVSSYDLTKSNSASISSRPWILIANDVFFYFVVWHSVSTPGDLSAGDIFAFGNFEKNHSTDGFPGVAAYGKTRSQLYYDGWGFYNTVNGNGSTYIGSPRSVAGTANAQCNLNYCFGGGPLVQTGSGTAGTSQFLGVSYTGQQLILSRPFLSDKSAVILRGWFPGLYAACHNFNDFSQLQTIEYDGRIFLCIKLGIYYNTANFSYVPFLIEIGKEW